MITNVVHFVKIIYDDLENMAIIRVMNSSKIVINSNQRIKGQVKVWEGDIPEQRVAASTLLRRYSFSLRLAIAQADARPAMPVYPQIGLHLTQPRSKGPLSRHGPAPRPENKGRGHA